MRTGALFGVLSASSLLLSFAPFGCAEYDGLVRAPTPGLDEANETSCSMVKDRSRPLVVEWPASARGDLEVRMRTGRVAVRYVGCAMQVLDRCTAGGAYRYVPFTPKEDRLVIRDRKELFANLPMGAMGLEGKLKTLGEIDLGMTLVGKFEADSGSEDDLHGDCAEATHVVTGMTVGAFALSAGGEIDTGAGASVFGVGAEARAKNQKETLSRDGDASMCSKASLEDTSPPRSCGAVVRVEVVPVLRRAVVADSRTPQRREPEEIEAAENAFVAAPPAAKPARRNVKDVPESRVASVAPGFVRRDPTKEKPSPCDGTSTADCMTRCTDGSAPSCLRLARTQGRDATYWLLYACIDGSAEGCTGVGHAYARGEYGEPDSFTADKWYGIAAGMRP